MVLTMRRYSIEVFGQTLLLHGVIESVRRLSDLVNEEDPYLAMTEIQTYPYMGDTMIGLDQQSQGLVNKDMILLVAETDAAALETPGVIVDFSVAKTPHRILIYTNHFAINADIHLAEGAELEQFLATSQGKFVAVTNATVMPTEPGTQLTSFRRDFMLVNRNHIAFLGTPEGTGLAALAPAQTEAEAETIG
jgi:hypothetical protein